MCEGSSQAIKHAKNYGINILTMKATIFDTHGITFKYLKEFYLLSARHKSPRAIHFASGTDRLKKIHFVITKSSVKPVHNDHP